MGRLHRFLIKKPRLSDKNTLILMELRNFASMGIRIKKIGLLNIGPFGKLQLSFPEKTIADKAEIHILTGENGTGKSTVLEAIVTCLKKNASPEFSMKWRKIKDKQKHFNPFKKKKKGGG